MQSIFLSYIQNEVSLSLLVLILLLLSPILAKYYKASSRYYMWLIPVIALAIPYNLPIDRPLWQINITPIIQCIPTTQDQEQTQLTDIPTPLAQDTVDQSNLPITDDRALTQMPSSSQIDRHSRGSTIQLLIYIWFIGFMISIACIILSHIRFMHYSHKWCEPIKDSNLLSIIYNLQTKFRLHSKLQVQYCKILNTPITIGETSCDETVLISADEDTRLQYGEIIIDIIRHSNVKCSILSSAFFIEKKKIKERLSGIMNTQLKQNGKLMITFIAVLVILSGTFLGFTNNFTHSKNNELTLPNKAASLSNLNNSLTFNRTIKPQLTSNLCTLTMKKGEAITYSLQAQITDSFNQVQSDYLTILFIDTQNAIHQLQLSNQNTTATFVAEKDDTSAQNYYHNTGNMIGIVNNLNSIDADTLGNILTDYIEKTDDIGMLFTCIDYVDQSTIDSIMINYIKRTDNIGMVFSAMDYLSQSAIDQIAKNYASTNPDIGMIETLRPYVSKGVL